MIIITVLYFIGFFLFPKKKILFNVRTKGVHETDFLLKVRTDSLLIRILLYRWLHCISVETDFFRMCVRIIFTLRCGS